MDVLVDDAIDGRDDRSGVARPELSADGDELATVDQ